jgi:hypothetical protein
VTLGSGDLTILASQHLGDLGAGTSAPAILDWRWYYQVPGLAFWCLVVLPLALVKENRRRQAWAIVLPLLAVLVAGRMISILLALSPATGEAFGRFVMTLATAWTIVWLLEPWFAGRGGVRSFFAALVVMWAIALLSYLGNFGLAYSDDLLPWASCYAIATLALLLSMAISGRCCRTTFSSGRFMAWLLLWLVLATVVGVLLLAVGVVVFEAATEGIGALMFLAVALPGALIAGGIGGVLLYLANLPFLLVASRSVLYRDRFLRALQLRASPTADRSLE